MLHFFYSPWLRMTNIDQIKKNFIGYSQYFSNLNESYEVAESMINIMFTITLKAHTYVCNVTLTQHTYAVHMSYLYRVCLLNSL